MQIEEEEKIYRIGNGSIRACLRGKVKRYPDVEVSPPPRRREREACNDAGLDPKEIIEAEVAVMKTREIKESII